MRTVTYGKKLTCITLANHTTGRGKGGKEGAREGVMEAEMQCGEEKQGRREGGQESRGVGW